MEKRIGLTLLILLGTALAICAALGTFLLLRMNEGPASFEDAMLVWQEVRHAAL